MNKKKYWIGLPTCFILFAGATFLIPKTYESSFVIVQDDENAGRHVRVMAMNKNENYDLGLTKTYSAFDMYAYRELITSDPFLRRVLEINVRTLDGQFDGSYFDYCVGYCKKSPVGYLIDLFQRLNQPKAEERAQEMVAPLTKAQSAVCKNLKHTLEVEVDYESEFVSFTCSTQDPLVSKMLGDGILRELNSYIAEQNQQKTQTYLKQLDELIAEAEANYERDPSGENLAIISSFKRQEVIYKSQMSFVDSFSIVSAPSFDFKKTSPSRWKMPLLLTLLIGLGMWGWENKEKVIKYLLS